MKSNSFFLFGPRGTGKTTFIRHFFREQSVLWLDLLDADTEEKYQLRPNQLLQELEALRKKNAAPEWVVIDEVQKVPKLLDLVHLEIEKYGTKFALTGSSARKLKMGAANLLAGRAFMNVLHPLTSYEVGDTFDVDKAMRWGTLPKIFHLETEREKKAYLKAYSQTYLKEEVWGEQLVKKIEPFRKFLEIAAQTNGKILNYSNISRDVGVDIKTVQNYYQILEDTLLGFLLPSYSKSIRKQQNKASKFYFFDPGLYRSIAGLATVPIVPKTFAYGEAFESFIVLELFRLNDYYEKDYRFSYLRTKDNAEIDIIIDRPGQPSVLIEIKSKTQVDERDTRTLESFISDFENPLVFCISQDQSEKYIGNVLCLNWRSALAKIFPQ